MSALEARARAQKRINGQLLESVPLFGSRVESKVVPLRLSLDGSGAMPEEVNTAMAGLEKEAATVAIQSLVSLAKAGDIDHLGGGLELIPPLLMTLGVVDYDRIHFTVEHAHTSIGYYSALAALGFIDRARVIEGFRRSIDIPGHVSWLPGGTELSGGRLGVMVPVSVGQALALRARRGTESLVFCHCGDAGWISGQALNGFVAASLHKAPVIFVMHRNGIQLSGTTSRIMPKDPRGIIGELGVEILEIGSLHDRAALFSAYREAATRARSGRPTLIYPVGYRSSETGRIDLAWLGRQYGIETETIAFAAKQGVPMDSEIWVPGSLMSFRDERAMLECIFYVNGLPGGEAHHDGGMKGRDAGLVLENPMLRLNAAERAVLSELRSKEARLVVTEARPARGADNLLLSRDDLAAVKLPGCEKPVTARLGVEEAYVALAKKYPKECFFVSCDLDPSTRLGKAASLVPSDHRIEMSIQEQAAALLTNGLALGSRESQINVFATFTAFIEGIAREGFELWRYQRNLTGANEGLNVIMHLSHVGACTGRDHFSGWSLDWINLAMGYLPFLRRFYAPSDARSAFLAVRDAAAGYGGHIVAVPRDSLPVLTRQGTNLPVWSQEDPWTPLTVLRRFDRSQGAIVVVGAPAFVAIEAAEEAMKGGTPIDVYVINGWPLPPGELEGMLRQYSAIATLEDGLIGTPESGLRGLAAYVASILCGSAIKLVHFGIVDPSVAPPDHYIEVWRHFGMTQTDVREGLLGILA